MKNISNTTGISLLKYLPLYLGMYLITGYATAQTANFENAAEALQQAAYNTYISSDGSYFIQSNDGNTSFNYWWNANALDALTQGYIRTRQESYKQRMKTILEGIKTQHGGTYINDFYDDMEWLTLACLKAYEVTKDTAYYNVATLLWQDIQTGRSPEYEGAVTWNKGCHPSCKNAISNSPAALIGARLYRINSNAQNLQIAEEIHAFVKSKLVDPQTGGVWDSYNPVDNTTDKRSNWIFSYNVGMYLAASVELYKVTGQRAYLDDAVKSAEFAINNRLVNSVFFTNEGGQGDGGLFKGIFIRCLIQLARETDLPEDTRARYNNIIQYNAQVLLTQGSRTDHLVGPVWNATPNDITLDYSTQLSGIMLLEAAAAAGKVILNQDINYGGYSVQLKTGHYTLSDLVSQGAQDNDITSLSIPPGYEVTLFENDNFTGASTKLTSNTSWLGDWNDRASSIIVASKDITGLGGNITGEHTNSPANEGVGNLIDDNPGTKYLAVSSTGWVQFQADQAYVVNGYSLTSGNDADERDPLSWTLQASTDSTNWTTLDSLSGEDFPYRIQRRVFSIENTQAYVFYRFNFSNNEGGLLQLSEIELFGDSLDTPELRAADNPDSVTNGLAYAYYEGNWKKLPDFSQLTVLEKGGSANFDLSLRKRDDQFAVLYEGYIEVPTDGLYTFYTSSDDGSILWIGHEEVVNNDGHHNARERSGSLGLKSGKHAIKVGYFERRGKEVLQVRYKGPGLEKQAVPDTVLFRDLSLDIEAPTIPANLEATEITQDAVNLQWVASSDNVGVQSYRVYQDDELVLTIDDTITTITELQAETEYRFSVSAVDSAGNESAQASLTVTTRSEGIEEELPFGNGTIRIYPNPFEHDFTISLAGDELKGAVGVVVFNLQGHIVAYSKLSPNRNYTTQINLQGKPAGIYVVSLFGYKVGYVSRIEKK